MKFKGDSRLVVEQVNHRLSNAIESRCMMNDRAFFKALCFDIISARRSTEYLSGLLAGLKVSGYYGTLSLWAADYNDKTYLFHTQPRDLPSLVSHIMNSPYKHKKYKEDQIATVMYKCAKLVNSKYRYYALINKIFDIPILSLAIEWCRDRVRENPKSSLVRNLYVILNHPLASQERWTMALELMKIDVVHQ